MFEKKLGLYFFFSLFVGVLVVVGILFFPFFGALALALVLSVLGAPVFRVLKKVLKNETISALLTTFGIGLCIVVPAAYLLTMLVGEVQSFVGVLASFDPHALPPSLQSVHDKVLARLPFLQGAFDASLLHKVGQEFAMGVSAGVTGVLSATLSFFVAGFALYYFLKDGVHFSETIIALSPLAESEDRLVMKKIRAVSLSLIQGTLGVALLQGLLMGFGLWIFEVPNPVLWGACTALVALIPSVGTGFISLPIALYLFWTGSIVSVVGFLIWAFLVVGLVDNMIRPFLIGRDTHIHPLFVLLSILGGVAVLGVSGILIGPLFFGLLVALAEIYRERIRVMREV
jgi:predicted PurR-regulated permease PerM